MKYCSKCGNELLDEAVMCPKCGCMVENRAEENKTKTDNDNVINIIVKVLLLLGCIGGAFLFLVPLIWCIPITVKIFKCLKNGEEISTGLKVGSIFVNFIAGIILLVREK